ncbi:MAG: hypothetical protein AAF517_13170 [Planctomycetota bacterium]
MKTEIHAGELPVFWDRSVVFFANLLDLFFGNEGETDALVEQVSGLEYYGGRLAPILDLIYRGRNNVLVVERAPSTELLSYFSSLGLSLPQIVAQSGSVTTIRRLLSEQRLPSQGALTPELSTIADSQAGWLDGFVTHPDLTRLAEGLSKTTINTVDGSRNGNNKLLLHRHLEQQGLPVFETRYARDVGSVLSALAELAKMGFGRAAIKAQIGASGVGLVQLDTSTSSEEELRACGCKDFLFEGGECMVQGWLGSEGGALQMVGSPSVQLFLTDETLHLFDLTEQILGDDSIHEGNVAPPPFASSKAEIPDLLLEQAAIAGRWLHETGYRGTASVDFLVVERDGKPESYVCEINARVTGATYPSVLARHFRPHGAWVMRNFRFARPVSADQLLSSLNDSGRLFRGEEQGNVLPINFSYAPDARVNKAQFLFLRETPEACFAELDSLREELTAEWRFDRD